MKFTLNKYNLFIIVVLILFLIVTLWILKTDVFVTYESPYEFAEKSSDLAYKYTVISQEDDYAVCLAMSYDPNKPDEFYLLSIMKNGEWKVLKENSGYKTKYYTNRNINPDFNYIYTFKIKNTNKNIIIVSIFVNSEKYGEYIFNEDEKKLQEISDSQDSVFYYKSMQIIGAEFLNILYIGFVDNFDEDTYMLNINGKQYPYKEWKELLKRN